MSKNSSDPRYRVNIKPGMRVMIQESCGSEFIPCYVKEIITGDPKHESGIKVSCEGGRIGRVKYIGTESTYKPPIELITILEKQIRKLIEEILSRHDLDWWNIRIPSTIKNAVEKKLRRGGSQRQKLKIPKYEKIEETDFFQLHMIIGYKKNWSCCFEPIFKEKSQTMKKLKDLATYRNLPAHSKDLTEDIEKKIRDYFDDLILLIEDYYRKKNQTRHSGI